MRNYLMLRDRVRAFRADPEVLAALSAARLDELAQATLAPGETLTSLRGEAFDPDAAALRAWHSRSWTSSPWTISTGCAGSLMGQLEVRR